MCSSARHVSMGFTNQEFPAGIHMCLIYNNEEERRQTIARFLAAGLTDGERVGYFADESSPEQVLEMLEAQGVARTLLDDLGRMQVGVAEKVYCPDGTFVPDRMLDTLRAYHNESVADGLPGSRVSGEMSWALRGIPGSDRLMEYEAKVNIVVATHPVTAICQYDANRFDGATIIDVLSVHPVMVVRGQIVHNPYYMKPEDFLKDFYERK